MRKFLWLLSLLCIAIVGVSCQTNGNGSSNTASRDSYVEQSSESDSEGNGLEDSTENKNDEWADIEFPRL